MTITLDLKARAGAAIACDMTTAADTPEERLEEYGRLFERSLLRRERRPDSVVLVFGADARERVEDVARREHACCPFLGYRVEVAGDEVIWTIGGDARADVQVILDAFGDADATRTILGESQPTARRGRACAECGRWPTETLHACTTG